MPREIPRQIRRGTHTGRFTASPAPGPAPARPPPEAAAMAAGPARDQRAAAEDDPAAARAVRATARALGGPACRAGGRRRAMAGPRLRVLPAGRPAGQPRDDWQEWADILKAGGVAHRGVHIARHSAATIAINEGLALTVVQEMLGTPTSGSHAVTCRPPRRWPVRRRRGWAGPCSRREGPGANVPRTVPTRRDLRARIQRFRWVRL